jgi:Kef-type K+ transport system membrane component KefB
MGWGLAAWYGSPAIEAVFVGTALVATSVGITAQVLAARGLLKEKASQMILAAAVVDDVLGLLVLAAVSGSASGQFDWKKLLLTTGLAVGFVLAALFWGAPMMKRWGPKLGRTMRGGESELTVAMVALFALAALAEHAGVAAIVGAFLAGMMLAETASGKIHHVAHGTTELLVPFFLVSIGLQVDLRAFTGTALLWATLVLTVVAVVSKIAGCGLAALPMGRKEAWRIGVGMVPRGEVGMIVAQMGMAAGALGKEAFAAVVMMAAATTMVAPPLIKLAFRGVEAAEETEVLRLG